MRPPHGNHALLRGLAAGVPAGTVGGFVLCALLLRRGVPFDSSVLLLLVVAAAGGAGFGLLVRERNPGEALFFGVAYGALAWWLIPLTLQPLLARHSPAWSVAAAQGQFASLLACLLYGASTGLAYAVLRRRRHDRTAGALLRGALAGTMVAMLLHMPGGLVVGPLLGLAQGWTVEQARSTFPALLAYLLLGVAVALVRQCLDGLAALLSPERLRTYPGAGLPGGPV